MKIHIKNMVCDRCTLVVSSILESLALPAKSIELGQIDFGQTVLSENQLLSLKSELEKLGFELLDDKKSQLIDKIKTVIITLVHQHDDLPKIRLSEYLKEKINYDYNHISQLFSSIEGITIEQYFINHKIERVKELLVYDELSNTEIAYKLGYSSPAHLSGQFKKNTGMTPGQFKKLRDTKLRKPLDHI